MSASNPTFKYILVTIAVVFSLSGTGIAALNLNDVYADLALEYFQSRGVSQVIMFICWNVKDRVKVMKLYSENGMSVSQPYGVQDPQMIRDMFRTEGFYMGVIFDVSCYSQHAPSQPRTTYFNSSYIWITFDYGQFDFIKKYTSALPLTIATDGVVTKTSPCADGETYSIQLYDIYNPAFDKGQPMNMTYMGNWVKGDGPTNTIWKNFVTSPKVKRRHNLRGLNFRAVTLAERKPPEVPVEAYLQDEHFPYLDSVFRMNYRLIRLLQQLYNFTITIVMADNWTDKNTKGYYRSSNLIGVLAEKKADVMAGALQLMSDRLPLVDVVHMTYPFRSGFIFRFSGNFGNISLNFLRPFDGTVWIIMLFVSAVIVASVWFIFMFENRYFIQQRARNFSLSDATLSILTAWCQMGSGVHPSTHASRLVYVTLFFNSLILYNFYTSSIVSSLLSYRSQTFTIVDLANSPMKCGSLDTGYVHNLLFDTPVYPNMKYFNERKKRDPFYLSVIDGVQSVKEGDFAYHVEYSMVYPLISDTFEPTEVCELQEVDTIRAGLGIMAQKHSPYTEMFRVGLTKARETGQLKRLLERWVAKKPACQASKSVSGVNLLQTVSMFFVLVCGQVLAVMVLFCERHNWKKKQIISDNKHKFGRKRALVKYQ